MARLRSNHINVTYVLDNTTAKRALSVKAAMMDELSIRVHLCGEIDNIGTFAH